MVAGSPDGRDHCSEEGIIAVGDHQTSGKDRDEERTIVRAMSEVWILQGLEQLIALIRCNFSLHDRLHRDE